MTAAVSSATDGLSEGGQGDLDHVPALTPRGVDAGTHGETMQPGVEPLGLAQRRQLAPGFEHRVLDGVSRELRVPDDEASGCVQPGQSGRGEHGEGVMIASPGPLHQLQLLHDRLTMRRGLMVALQGNDDGAIANRSRRPGMAVSHAFLRRAGGSAATQDRQRTPRLRTPRHRRSRCGASVAPSSPRSENSLAIVDHVIPKVRSGSDEPSNLQSVCTQHHRIKTSAAHRCYTRAC